MPYHWFQILAELLHRAKYTVLGCVRSRTERCTDLLNRQALKMAQDESRSFLRAQFVQCLVYAIPHLSTVRHPLRARRVHRNSLQEVALFVGASFPFVFVTLAHAN